MFRDWNCRQPELLIDFLEIWMSVLPSWILDNLIEMVIFPKLTLEVEEWNPLTDTVPIHTWIHPWLPIMSKCIKIVASLTAIKKNIII